MIDAPRLLKDLQRLLGELEADLRERVGEVAEINAALREQYRAAKDAGRAGETYEVWRDGFLTQAAVAWILGGVFVRFLEDNVLIDPPRLAGPGERGRRALDEQELYFRHADRRTHSDRDYLLHVFEQVRALPAAAELFDPRQNPLWAVGPTGDGATRLLRFWQRVDPDTGALAHDFTDPGWNTRFLGDLYQDLSEDVRKKYALLQTPEFVEAFILDRTLTPAIEEFGFQVVRLLDPTCGSGHFLLGAFERLFDLWVRHEPGTNPRVLAQRALDQVYGVDLNPYAVAIARFRLLIAALKASEVRSLSPDQAPALHVNVAAGDSLLHGRRFGQLDLGSGAEQISGRPGIGHAFLTEDLPQLNKILGQRYQVVVGNPPYVTAKDRVLNQLYRDRYSTCHRKYSLVVPFIERFFDLGSREDQPGYIGLISANSFMKREFGRPLIEQFLVHVDLTHIIDTEGVPVPGHGTATCILFGRARSPLQQIIRTVMGVRSDSPDLEDPQQGFVWSALVRQVDNPGYSDNYISVADTPRRRFAKHPWTLGGGGAAELKEAIESARALTLGDLADAIGFAAIIAEDNAFLYPKGHHLLSKLPESLKRPFVHGELVRDWALQSDYEVVFPYSEEIELRGDTIIKDFLWNYRTTLWCRPDFSGKAYRDCGRTYWEYHQIPKDRNRRDLAIAFANVATHNHFVLHRGDALLHTHAPMVCLKEGQRENEYLSVIAALNSSVACFWMKAVFYCKGMGGINEGTKQEKWERFYEFDGTKLKQFPLAAASPVREAVAMDLLARQSQMLAANNSFAESGVGVEKLREIANSVASNRAKMIALQEEVDWAVYKHFCLTDSALVYEGGCPPGIALGARAFEIVMARQMESGELETTWFERHGSTPIIEIPADWPDDYRRLVERRIALIESDRNIRLIEQPEYKRRWNQEPWEVQEARALRSRLLDQLETDRYWPTIALATTRSLADIAAEDADFMQVAALYRGHPDFDVHALIAELVEDEAVPFLPVLRYKESGLRNRAIWDRTWDLQRREDDIDALVAAELRGSDQKAIEAEQKRRKHVEVGDIPAPPKYKSADFLSTTFWRLRGALDVPKERFISFPHCSKAGDPSLVIAWAGWDHLQQARALAEYYLAMKEQEGWTADRLTPLLAGLLELVRWVQQWHNDPDPSFGGTRMGDYFADFVAEEARELQVTPDQIRGWAPPAGTGARRGRKKKAAAE